MARPFCAPSTLTSLQRVRARALFACATSIALASIASPSVAQQAPQEQSLDALKACRALSGDAERLACYDRAAGEIVGAADRGEIRVVTKADVEQTRRGLFGFTLPKLGLFGGREGEEEPEPLDLLESSVTSARQIDRTTYVFKIAEGNATWQIREAPSRFIGPRVGDKVVFKRATMGTYFIRVNNQIGVRGRRIE